VAQFFGTYEHSLDSKGRVILPARFRADFEHGGYLTQYLDGCLALWTPDEFSRQMQDMQMRAASGKSERNMARLWASRTQDLEIDRQGRMVVPARMREYAELESDVLVVGAIERVELWDPSRWEERIAPEEQRLMEGADA
jgi:MraZ protein